MHTWVLPENWPALELFSKLQTQWHFISGMAVQRTGLNYQSADILIQRLFADEDYSDLLSRLQVIEQEFLKLDRN